MHSDANTCRKHVAHERELELLEDYRASLISRAVTGKVDVHGLVAERGEAKPVLRLAEPQEEYPMAAEDAASYGEVVEG